MMHTRWIPWVVAVVAPTLAVACNSITGLDDFELLSFIVVQEVS